MKNSFFCLMLSANIGKVEIRNRIATSPRGSKYAGRDGSVTPRMVPGAGMPGRKVLNLMLSAALIVCASAVIAAADEVSFARDIAPVLKAKCAACHLTGQEAGNLALHPGAAYASLVNVPSRQSKLLHVKPGSPELSYLVLKIEGRHLDAGGTGVPMPLDETTLQRIRAWIAAGAAQN